MIVARETARRNPVLILYLIRSSMLWHLLLLEIVAVSLVETVAILPSRLFLSLNELHLPWLLALGHLRSCLDCQLAKRRRFLLDFFDSRVS